MSEIDKLQNNPEIELLLACMATGDKQSQTTLLNSVRPQITNLVARQMSYKLGPRLDPSDIVQDALIVVARELHNYLRNRSIPLLVWIYRIVWQRIKDSHRRHVICQRRSVLREQPANQATDDSSIQLADQLIDKDSGPLSKLVRKERIEYLRQCLDSLSDDHREMLCMRYLDGLPISDVANIIGISIGAAKMRQLRALESLRIMLDRAT